MPPSSKKDVDSTFCTWSHIHHLPLYWALITLECAFRHKPNGKSHCLPNWAKSCDVCMLIHEEPTQRASLICSVDALSPLSLYCSRSFYALFHGSKHWSSRCFFLLNGIVSAKIFYCFCLLYYFVYSFFFPTAIQRRGMFCIWCVVWNWHSKLSRDQMSFTETNYRH